MALCPYCAEEIQDAAVKCKHCGEWLGASRRPNQESEPSPATANATRLDHEVASEASPASTSTEPTRPLRFPVGIRLLGALLIVIGIGGVISNLALLQSTEPTISGLSRTTLLVVGFLLAVCGFGLVASQRWAWWLALITAAGATGSGAGLLLTDAGSRQRYVIVSALYGVAVAALLAGSRKVLGGRLWRAWLALAIPLVLTLSLALWAGRAGAPDVWAEAACIQYRDYRDASQQGNPIEFPEEARRNFVAIYEDARHSRVPRFAENTKAALDATAMNFRAFNQALIRFEEQCAGLGYL